MSLLGAYALPHPPLAVPNVGRGQENKIQKTLDAMNNVAQEIAELAPDTIIFITPHSTVYSDYFHISPNANARGDFWQFGEDSICMETQYDEELIAEISRITAEQNIPAGTKGERDANLDHGVLVPMWYINRQYASYKSVRISQSGLDSVTHYRLGECIKNAVEVSGRRAVLIASGDLSHKLSEKGHYGFDPVGADFDRAITQTLSSADFSELFSLPENLRKQAAECGYNSFMVLAGCFDRLSVDAKLLSYEGPFGVGYAVASFFPRSSDEKRNFAEQYEAKIQSQTEKLRASEDPYRALARQSLEHAVLHGKSLPFPEGLPDEMLQRKAGAFVSLHKNGQLRGCIGTISPATKNIAHEIIQNAVSAGLSDTRFAPVSASELPHLTYKVDILNAAESISDSSALDVKRYGVIVSCGHRRGLLLPNLDGIDTVEHQIEIARQKAGISENEPIKLERFEVIRYE